MYGTQAIGECEMWKPVFENDVNMYGTQAETCEINIANSLRMM